MYSPDQSADRKTTIHEYSQGADPEKGGSAKLFGYKLETAWNHFFGS